MVHLESKLRAGFCPSVLMEYILPKLSPHLGIVVNWASGVLKRVSALRKGAEVRHANVADQGSPANKETLYRC
jgi:hypothetical protein